MAVIHKIKLDETQEVHSDFSKGSIYFVGTATIILRYAGFTILTDPNFLHAGDHAHLGYGMTSKRLTNPAIEIDNLPPLDFCILSHMHGDHFDHVAEERLDKQLPILTTAHAASKLKGKGFRKPYALKTWESIEVKKGAANVQVTSMPGKHAPGLISLALPPVMGSMLEFRTATDTPLMNIYITGDTLVYKDLEEIPKRYRDIDLALLHLGGTRILGLLVTMDAEQGIQAIRIIRPHSVIPIHYNDYTVFKSPLDDFKRAAVRTELATEIIYLSHGETYTFEVPAVRVQIRER